jgi:hypothetical protein
VRSQAIKDKAVEKHCPAFSFAPDLVGPAKHRAVESSRDLFVQRLYDHRLKQEASKQALRNQLDLLAEHDVVSGSRVMSAKEINTLVER